MLVSLLLAGVIGGAIGWLLHRHRSARNTDRLLETLHRQQQQTTQAQSEVAMLTDDFNELKQRKQKEIDVLAQDAKQVPLLKQNLEKSQLLVKQMMQKHEARLKELGDENASLMQRIKDVAQREQVLNKIQSEINDDRRQGSSAAAGESVAAAVAATTGFMESDTADEDADETLEQTIDNNLEERATETEPENSSFDFDVQEEVVQNDVENEAEPVKEPKEESAEAGKEIEQLFDTVDQHDDLKQIFGIGPVTEKTLNKLGITSYSQLAELKQHDIDKIAEALQIFPGRIERDNWVGGARRQLEEVLEGL
jgi:predicted flap endonuclease-1-like 5' DNA nuclease